MPFPNYFNAIFVFVASVFSIFYAAKAVDIFGDNASQKPWAWKVHQIWLNFIGSATGWIALWFLFQKIVVAMAMPGASSFDWSNVVLFFTAFIGITGFLPQCVVSLIRGLSEMAARISGLLKS